MKPLNWQRNQLFQMLSKAGLQLTDFKEEIHPTFYRIRNIVNSSIWFEIREGKSGMTNGAIWSDGKYVVLRRPGKAANPNAQAYYKNIDDWETSLLDIFLDWVVEIERELAAPDLWLEATKAIQLFEPAAELPADKFTIAELGALHGQLRMLAQLFETSELLRAHQADLAELAQTAAVKAETFTKKDWQNWIKGAFISAISSLELTEEQPQELLALVRLAFGGLFLKQ